MKTLVAFSVACVALLAIVGWAFRPVAHDAASNVPTAARPATAPVASVTGGAKPADQPDLVRATGESAITQQRESSGSDNDEQASPAPALAETDDARPEESNASSEPVVHWASDDPHWRARQKLDEFREVLEANRYNEVALKAAVDLARELQQYDEACELLTQLVQLHPDEVAPRFELATTLMRLKRWLDAIPHLRFVVEHEPDHAHAWYNLAVAHQALGHLSEAHAAWNRAIELMPENPDAYAQRGEVLLDLHDWSAAADDFQTALRLDSEPPIELSMNLSLGLCKLGRLEDARAALLPVHQRRPQHVPVLNRLAEIAWELYRADSTANAKYAGEAADWCRQSLAIHADQPEIQALLERASHPHN